MIILFTSVGLVLFKAVIALLNKQDEKADLKVGKKDFLLMGMVFALTEAILSYFYGCGREFLCHSLILFYLISAAMIDHKTRKVYRIGSIVFIGVSVAMFFGNWNGDSFAMIEKLTSIFVFSMLVIFQGMRSMMGWGDVLTYVGAFFWLGALSYECMTIEVLAVYMLIANLLFFICNIRKFDWKGKTMKEEVAFLPAMAGAAVMILWGLNWIKS